jgi:hypothetical protein
MTNLIFFESQPLLLAVATGKVYKVCQLQDVIDSLICGGWLSILSGPSLSGFASSTQLNGTDCFLL